jgi:hypothetical protein
MSKNAIFLQKYFIGNDSSAELSTCQRWASNICFKISKSQIRKFLGSLRYCKATMPVLKSHIQNFFDYSGNRKSANIYEVVHNQLCLKTVLKFVFYITNKLEYFVRGIVERWLCSGAASSTPAPPTFQPSRLSR